MDTAYRVIVLAFMLVVAVIVVYRMRPGGLGPGTRWVPRRFRQARNEEYREAGWQEPFDKDGNRNPNRSKL